VANLFLGLLNKYLNETDQALDISKINPTHFQQLFDLVKQSKISSTVAKQLVIESYKTGQPPLDIASQKKLLQISDTKQIETLVAKVLADNPKAVEDYKNNPNSLGFLIGQVMKASQGSANPKLAKQILLKLL